MVRHVGAEPRSPSSLNRMSPVPSRQAGITSTPHSFCWSSIDTCRGRRSRSTRYSNRLQKMLFISRPGTGAERDENVHLRRQQNRRVLRICPASVIPSRYCFPGSFSTGLISSAARREERIRIGNQPVPFQNRGSILVNSGHGQAAKPLTVYRQNAGRS